MKTKLVVAVAVSSMLSILCSLPAAAELSVSTRGGVVHRIQSFSQDAVSRYIRTANESDQELVWRLKSRVEDSTGIDFGSARLRRVETLTEGHTVAEFVQMAGELPLLNSSISLVFDDEKILGASGDIHQNLPSFEPSMDGIARLEEHLSGVISRSVSGDFRLRRKGESEFVRFSTSVESSSALIINTPIGEVAAEQHYDPANGSIVWLVRSGDGLYRTYGTDGSIVDEKFHSDNYGNAQVRRNVVDASDYGDRNGHTWSTVSMDKVGQGICVWDLEYSASSWGIDAVTWSTSLDSHVGSCSQTPQIASGTNYITDSDFGEANAYYWLKEARDYFVTNGLAVSGAQTFGAKIMFYAPSAVKPCSSTAAACYEYYPDRTIWMRSYRVSTFTLLHEYGHYLNDLHGPLLGGCNNLDQARSIAEGVASVLAFSVLYEHLDDNGYSIGYGDKFETLSTFDGGSDMRHFGNSSVDIWDHGCSDLYDHALFFTTAYLEVMFNLDCDNTSCTTSTTWGGDIGWGSNTHANRTNARRYLYRSVLYALKIMNGTGHEYEDIVYWMYVYLNAYAPSGVASGFRDVMEHHGVTI